MERDRRVLQVRREAESDPGRDHVPRVGDAVFEAHRAHRLEVVVGHLLAPVELERARVGDRGRHRDGAGFQGRDGGEHLEHGAWLVDARNHRIDEPAGVDVGGRPVVIRVV